MRVFLTGASGYIGTHVARELLSRGHEVIGLARKSSDRTRRVPAVRWLFADLSDLSRYMNGLNRSDAVVHCAMDYSSSGENAELDRQFVDRMLGFDGHFIYTGNLFSHRFSAFLDEAPQTESNHWRFQTEIAALGRRGISSVIRLGFVYGGNGGYFWNILSPGTLAGLESAAIPHVLWPMVHVRDVATLYAHVLEADEGGVYHAFDGTRVYAEEVVQTTRLVYEQREATGSESHNYIDGLLKASVVTSNRRSRSIGWRPAHRSFRECADNAYAENVV